jgi:hypothetical protein
MHGVKPFGCMKPLGGAKSAGGLGCVLLSPPERGDRLGERG